MPIKKKHLLLSVLLLSSIQYTYGKIAIPRVCEQNNWTMVSVKSPTSRYPTFYCVLPDGSYYRAWDLERQNEKYHMLFHQHSGKSPTPEQVEKARIELYRQGYHED